MQEQNSPIRLRAEDIDRHFQSWADHLASGPSDHKLAEAAIEAIYQKQGLIAPAVFWCQSPYQMITLPSLVFGIVHSDLWQWISGGLAQIEDPELLVREFDQQWPQVWANAGFPLLQGMNATSRLMRNCGHLEGALTSQVKSQLLRAVQNRSLDAVVMEWKREIYRVFWSNQRPADPARMLWLKLKDDVFTTVQYVHSQNGQWEGWGLGHNWDRRLDALGMDLASFLSNLAAAWGAEPAAQESCVTWFAQDLNWLAAAQLFLDTAGDTIDEELSHRAKIWIDLTKAATGAMFLPGVVFLCERFSDLVTVETEVARGTRFSFHNETGAVLSCSDGFEVYAWHDVRVPEAVIMAPDTITVEMIENEPNAEVRRIMIERYGITRYIEDCDAEVIDSDDFGTLYRKEVPFDEAIVMVKVVNSTPEPDGSYKDYFLRVPPQLTSAKQAVAWTFGFEPDEDNYDPSVQT